jgi:hypothetical protein
MRGGAAADWSQYTGASAVDLGSQLSENFDNVPPAAAASLQSGLPLDLHSLGEC